MTVQSVMVTGEINAVLTVCANTKEDERETVEINNSVWKATALYTEIAKYRCDLAKWLDLIRQQNDKYISKREA